MKIASRGSFAARGRMRSDEIAAVLTLVVHFALWLRIILVPAQYYDGSCRHTKVVSGEQRLMLALIADAIRVLLKPGLRNRRLGVENRSSLAGVPAVVSFDDACEAVRDRPPRVLTGCFGGESSDAAAVCGMLQRI